MFFWTTALQKQFPVAQNLCWSWKSGERKNHGQIKWSNPVGYGNAKGPQKYKKAVELGLPLQLSNVQKTTESTSKPLKEKSKVFKYAK